jgi:hypothetical protein
MRQLLLLSFLLMALPAWPQAATSSGPAVTVEVSRVHCLVRFVETLARSNNTYSGSRRIFEQSRFNTPAARRWIRRYQALDHEPSFDREGYPSGRVGSMGSTEPS